MWYWWIWFYNMGGWYVDYLNNYTFNNNLIKEYTINYIMWEKRTEKKKVSVWETFLLVYVLRHLIEEYLYHN